MTAAQAVLHGERPPNPGSNEALNMGCLCPVLDNNHGKWAPWPPDGWWTTAGCPIHDANWEVGA